ncbi:MAG: hypothetical protein J6R80_00930, partial [Kiritimatiellae bacterium]|nr:hypothetical protein [Kiritimatiellia bacterium]
MKKIKLLCISASVVAAAFCHAAVNLAEPFADGAILQRGMKVPVWGTATAGEKVTLTFAGKTVTAVVDATGFWRADLPEMQASSEGHVLKVVGDASSVEVKDVLVGEVWFCCGQSNTAMPLVGGSPRFRDWKGAMRAQMTNERLVRFCCQSNYKTSPVPKKNCPLKVEWKAFTPKNLSSGSNFSAMGVYYALELYRALHIPVGIIGAYWGGTRIEPWTPRCGLESVNETAALANAQLYEKGAYEKLEKKPFGPTVATQPSVLWNEMVAPWTPYAIRGFIWYQGCSNAGDGAKYTAKMHALYNGWAKEFENPLLKLRFVQLAPWGNPTISQIQMAQAKFALEEPNAKMAVINDRGNLHDIHPCDKETVGQRLALLAMKYDYGFNLRAESPTVMEWKVDGDAVIVTFNDVS